MKKKIGFIDYYIDEWHAHNYPRFICEAELGSEYEVAMAWEMITPEGKMPLQEWCSKEGVAKAGSIEEIVDACDCLIVLSPDNPEMHEKLAQLPLKSGKPVYVDKPFARTLAEAQRMFALAKAHGTPLMSCSALRYGSALQRFSGSVAASGVRFAATRGGGMFSNYSIHQIEMLVVALGTGASRVIQLGNEASDLMLVDYPDGRRGTINLMHGAEHPFDVSLCYGENQTTHLPEMIDFFPHFMNAVLGFFKSGKSPVPEAQTLETVALLQAGDAALAQPGTWVEVPR